MNPSRSQSAQRLGSFIMALVCTTGVLSFSPRVAGQESPPLQYGEEISVRVVTLPLLARDRRGRPITDLKVNEITVREGKRTYRVESLTRVLSAGEAGSDLPKARLITGVGEETRQVGSTSTAAQYMVVVVDVENDPATRRKEAVDALGRFLERELPPSFQVALLLYDGSLKQLVPFTHDRPAVIAALPRVYTDMRPRAARVAPEVRMRLYLRQLELCEDAEGMVDPVCLHDSMYEYAGESNPRAMNFVHALDAVVTYVEGLEGHKTVLLVGGNVSLNPAREAAEAVRAMYGPRDDVQGFEQSLQAEEAARPHLDRMLNRAFQNDVSFSILDRTPAPSDVSARQGQQFQPGYRPMTTAFHAAQQDLDEIAAVTGGSFVASTRVDEGLKQSMELIEAVYDLSVYVPDNDPLTERRLRRISVTTTRPGVRLRYRRGHERRRGADDVAFVNLRGTIQAGPPEPQEIDGRGVDLIPLRFAFHAADLGYEEQGDRAVAAFAVHLRLRTTDDILLADTYRVLTHSYPLDLWRKGDIEPPALIAFAEVPPGEYIAEALVTIPRLQRRGTLRAKFTAGGPAAAVGPPTRPSGTYVQNMPAAPPAPVASNERAAVTTKRQARTETDRENRPSLAFSTHFLGVVSGLVEVGVIPGRDATTVELLLDGERVGSLDSEPWTLPVSLGDAPSPRELVAIARDERGREIGRAQQWLNLPRPWTELEVVLVDGESGRLTGQISWESVDGEDPLEVTATLDGLPLTVSETSTIELPVVDMETIHLLRVEARFENAGTVARDVVFGGQYTQLTDVELSSVAVELREDRDVRIDDVQLHSGGRRVPIVALEKGPADVIVVIDPRAIRLLPGITVAGRLGSVRNTLSSPGIDARITPPRADVELRLVWPVADESQENQAGQFGYRLFPATPPGAGSSSVGLLGHVAGATFPAVKGSIRLADALTVAGPMASERGRRRVVLLVLGGSKTEGQYSAVAARSYLDQLRIPLVVWTIGTPRAVVDEWGAAEGIGTREGLRNAWTNLMKKLDRQRVAWLEGMYLPQTLESTRDDIELAGVARR